MIEEAWYPTDRCPHPIAEINERWVFPGVGIRMERRIRCLLCHAESGFPISWLNLAKRTGVVDWPLSCWS